MKSLVLLSVFAVLPAGLFVRSPAASATPAPEIAAYTIDAGHSSVVFRIKHMNVSYFYGRFNKVSGSVNYDEAKPENSTVAIEIPTDSVDTNNAGRDKDIKGPSFLSAAEFPNITFKSTKVAKKDAKLSVTGDLTFHGKTKSITLDVEPIGAADTQRGKKAGFEAVFDIKRSEYDSTGEGVGDEVRLIVSLECNGVKK